VNKGPGREHTPSAELRLSKLTVADVFCFCFVKKQKGRVHTPSAELRLSKLTVADIAGWVLRIGTLSKEALSGVGNIERALEAGVCVCVCVCVYIYIYIYIYIELVVKQGAIESLVQDAQQRQVHLAAAQDECDAILQV
jgi:hypothetical protein